MDCYGFNLIHQIYGKKMWLLFPPEENLMPTRVPYEESSVYSRLNFFSPKIENFKGLSSKCRKVELSPGDVLFVPHKWWHFVENLNTSIAINVWLPSVHDDKERLKESIVQYTVKQITDLSTEKTKKIILNPNMDKLLLKNDVTQFFNTINTCKRICKRSPHKKQTNEDSSIFNTKIVDLGIEVPVLSRDEFMKLMNQQISRFGEKKVPEETHGDDFVKLVRAFTNPEVINLITHNLISDQ
uniref:SHSP28 n=1 Tax=Agasicles hygrophila TaxID=715812 RepID=A0A7G8KP72_9CUCU|nr:sHSP28 [Agasicles hygrophila]